jgi:hypothetical protein
MNTPKKTVVVRKRLRFDIEGKLTLTGAPIRITPVLYISPFSVD